MKQDLATDLSIIFIVYAVVIIGILGMEKVRGQQPAPSAEETLLNMCDSDDRFLCERDARGVLRVLPKPKDFRG